MHNSKSVCVVPRVQQLLLLLLLGVQLSARSSPVDALSPTGEGCSDVTPPGDSSCLQRRGWGDCNDEWLIKGGFCEATCGRCERGPRDPIPVPLPGSLDIRRGRFSDQDDYPEEWVPCDDIPASSGYTCETQKGLGLCDREWYIQGAYCRKTCGQCKDFNI